MAAKWEIRASPELRDRVNAAAAESSMTQTAWVIKAVETALAAEASPDALPAEIEELRRNVGRVAADLKDMNALFKSRVKEALGELLNAQPAKSTKR